MKRYKRRTKEKKSEEPASIWIDEGDIKLDTTMGDTTSPVLEFGGYGSRFNPYNETWRCDKCGYQEDTLGKATVEFRIENNTTGMMCPNCLINFLKENVPQLRKVTKDD